MGARRCLLIEDIYGTGDCVNEQLNRKRKKCGHATDKARTEFGKSALEINVSYLMYYVILLK